jgi:hypothetical protein
MRQGESLTDAEEALLHHLATLKASVAEGVEAAPNLPARCELSYVTCSRRSS